MSRIDWMGTPMESFFSVTRKQADGTTTIEALSPGHGVAQRLVGGLSGDVEEAYVQVLSEEEMDRLESEGKAPLIRDGQKVYEALDRLTLGDLPAILDTLSVLEDDYRRREREKAERKAAERKERNRVRAKERRKLKKLDE